MNKQESFAFGLLAGMGLMYLLDPDRGARRRALIRDQVVHGAHELEDLGEAAGSVMRDVRNRARGAVLEARARVRDEPVNDVVLEERVRSEMGRLVFNPGAIEVTAAQGQVTLGGAVLTSELERLIAGVERVPGVREVVSRLVGQDEPGNTPDLQGANSVHSG